ncbi:Adenylosuccinate lyase [Campylobacter jejuni subsp. doylei]|uniref:Adenylosuccinate lyase n=1 Tax=Campylobacter jejuni subsp. doylei TaxID=32021 RepID=A0A3S4SBA6_CAMJU|nr:Adenylosuccinate lyase [Campylobacter jejuni subsp. doylei]
MTGISVFDHRLLADSWSTQEMRAIFCEQNRNKNDSMLKQL